MTKYDYDKLTPMMQQYLDIKKQYSDSILMFRMGDFYEMFFSDAELVSKELNIVLTGRDAGINEKIPMCGVPYHAAANYIDRLISRGYKVAICDQLEDPKLSKGLVKRGVTRVITPGTNLLTTEDMSSSSYLASIYYEGNNGCLSYVDFSTGNLFFTNIKEDLTNSNSNLRNQISVLQIKELVVNDYELNIKDIVDRKNILVNVYNSSLPDDEFEDFIKNVGPDKRLTNIINTSNVVNSSIKQLFSYLKDTQFNFTSHIRNIQYVNIDDYMVLDRHTLFSLDVFSETDKVTEGTLLHLLDKTKTSMGSRKLRYFLEHPLKNKKDIIGRLNVVEAFNIDLILLEELRNLLKEVYDIERVMVKLSGISNSPKDLIQLKKSINVFPRIKSLLKNKNIDINNLEILDSLKEIYTLIEEGIKEDPPLSPKEGGVVRESFSKELDNLKNSSINGKTWILDYETELKDLTGINKLKIKYNKILGYFIEVSNFYTDKVPDFFIRKQTLVGSERYFTEKLKNTEMHILNSKNTIDSLEFNIYEDIRSKVLSKYDCISKCADIIANIDVFSNFAHISYINNYTRPTISENNDLIIVDGRHPIVEKNTDIFIKNDTIIDDYYNFILLTGPNMAGKSTYMRQVALISLMMQIGCFIPCKEGKIPVFDRIFTRIGAHDNLYMGESTFMVEMKEMADIIENATVNSLIILDEVGRGTSTYDGLALAKALIEYIIKNINAKTIFATHFHELTTLDQTYNKIKNYTVEIKEKNGEINFLRKVIPGNSDKSYGIHVATLAGIKKDIVNKAQNYLDQYENKAKNVYQLGFLNKSIVDSHFREEEYNEIRHLYDQIKFEINSIDINSMTPIESMLKLQELKNLLKEQNEK